MYLLTLLTYVIIEANNVDPDLTAPKGAVRSGYTLSAEEASKTFQQTTNQIDFFVIST